MKPAVRQLLLKGGDGDANFKRNGADLRKLKEAVAKVRRGGRARLLIIGDSTTAGAGTGTNSVSTNKMVGARAKSYPTKLAQSLIALGIPSYNESLFGDQRSDEAYALYDPRVNAGLWGLSDVDSLGGQSWRSITAGATLAFTPAMTFDRFDVYTTQSVGAGAITVNVDGGAALATIDQNGASSVVKTTVSCTRGTHTINVVASSATQVFVIGIVPWDSTLGGLDILQCAHYGGTVTDVSATANPWSVANATLLNAIAADVAIVQLTINDSRGGTLQATYESRLATLDAALATAGAQVILMTGIPSSDAIDATATICSSVVARATARSYILADLRGRCGSYAAMNTIGWMNDAVHGKEPLYQDEADWLARNLIKLGA